MIAMCNSIPKENCDNNIYEAKSKICLPCFKKLDKESQEKLIKNI